MTNSVDTDEAPHLDLHFLQRYIFWSADLEGLKKRY